MITVTKLVNVKPLFDHTQKDPLSALRELDAAVASKYGVNHCRVLGFDLGLTRPMGFPTVGTSDDEFVVCVNPPELPA